MADHLKMCGVSGSSDGTGFEIQATTPTGRIRRVDMTRKQAFETIGILAIWLGRTTEENADD